MDWMDDVNACMKRKNKVLFAKDSAFLQELRSLLQSQPHCAVILWAFEFADETTAKLYARYPDDPRPEEAVKVSKAWAAGKVKMPVAQRAILQVHAMAKELSSPEDIALCHAVGQACGVVHTQGHAIGFPIYELTAIIRHHGIENCQAPVEARMQQYLERLRYWQKSYENFPCEWAGFLTSEQEGQS